MLTAIFLAAAVLQTTADDCAILEVMVSQPIPKSEYHHDVVEPDEVYVITRPSRAGFVFDCSGQLNALDACKRDQVQRFNELTIEQRIQAGSHLYEALQRRLGAVEFFRDDSGGVELPEGLATSFVEAVSRQQNWGCYSQGWRYYQTDFYRDLWESSSPDVPDGRSLQITHPGYSANNQFAVASFTEIYKRRPEPRFEGDLMINYIVIETGFVVFRRTENGWRLVNRIVPTRTRTGP